MENWKLFWVGSNKMDTYQCVRCGRRIKIRRTDKTRINGLDNIACKCKEAFK